MNQDQETPVPELIARIANLERLGAELASELGAESMERLEQAAGRAVKAAGEQLAASQAECQSLRGQVAIVIQDRNRVCGEAERYSAENERMRLVLEPLLAGNICHCDSDEEKETGASPAESTSGQTDFWGNPIWGERCNYCKARAVLERER